MFEFGDVKLQTEMFILLLLVAQWPKCVDESDFVGKARNLCFCDQNM